MKTKFELAITFECETEEQVDEVTTFIEQAISNDHFKEVLSDKEGINNVRVELGKFDLTNSAGDEVIGSFNNTANPAIEDIKERFARLYDLVELMESNSRIKAAIRTKVQLALLSTQQLFTKLFFLK